MRDSKWALPALSSRRTTDLDVIQKLRRSVNKDVTFIGRVEASAYALFQTW